MLYKSRFSNVVIPDISLPAYIFSRAEERSSSTVFIDGPTGRTMTYGQLWAGVKKVACGLHKRGFGKGDVFATFSPNVPEYALAWHGVALAGGVNTTANPLYTADELAYQLKDSNAQFLLTVPAFLEKATEAARKAGNIKEIFVFGEAPGATPFTALLDNDGAHHNVKIDPRKDLVALPYSSGTTGLPKGVMLTHHNIVSNLAQVEPVEPMSEQDTLVGILPFFHIYGMVVVMNAALRKGARIVVMPKFEMEPFLKIVQEYKVTRAHLVPPIVLGLTKHPLVANYDLSSLKVIISGAAPLGGELAEACSARIGAKVKQGYGLTETSPVTHLNPDDAIRAGAAGQLVANTEARIVDVETGKDAAAGERGEVWIRGPQVMQGYLNCPEDQKGIIDSDGFLHTGDIGYVDPEGYFFIVDRLKELIKYKGMQIAPAELEALLVTHPAVADAAVIPVPDEEAGEIPKAFVILKAQATTDELMAWVAERVAPHKKVRRMEVVTEIPKSASGKILRRILVEKERAKR